MVLRTPLRLSRCIYRSFSHRSAFLQLSPFTRRLFNLPPAPPPASLHHHDLPSFLAYAERTALPESSTTYVGTHYEYTVLQSLRRFAFMLHRVGGRDDAGIDLVGTWHLPRREHALRVVVQCKALRTKLGPNLVRELEGAFRHSPVGWRTSDKLAFLVSPREATRGVRDAMARSDYPLFWIMMERDGTIRQALWNGKVESLGLGALGVETWYRENSSDPAQKEITLTWEGEEFPDMDRVEVDMAQKQAEWVASWGCESLSETDKVELLEMVENAFPGGARHSMKQLDQSSLAAKRAEFLALLEEKSLRRDR
ncbi:hypothetical protein VTN77DRAFT_5600 [Rasamsonia byssochlamydoides]|uniref:uncharacterized protein n=1 Tax=Rasamsonia byssochlamydoides TaxID=89139 RepID=UPI003744A16D